MATVLMSERPRPAQDADACVAAPPIDPKLFRTVMGRFATGVTVVTAVVGSETFGMTANAFLAGSLEPPLCVVSVGRSAKMHARLEAAGCFGVSFLNEDQTGLSQHFAGRSVDGVEPEFRYLGTIPVLRGSVGAVAARIVEALDCGDHTLFIGRVAALDSGERQPLLFYGGRYAALDREQRLEKVAPHSFW